MWISGEEGGRVHPDGVELGRLLVLVGRAFRVDGDLFVGLIRQDDGFLAMAAAAQRGRKVQTASPQLQPSAASLAEIALESGETVSVLRPLYLRPPDARPQATAVARR